MVVDSRFRGNDGLKPTGMAARTRGNGRFLIYATTGLS